MAAEQQNIVTVTPNMHLEECIQLSKYMAQNEPGTTLFKRLIQLNEPYQYTVWRASQMTNCSEQAIRICVAAEFCSQ